MTVAEYVAQLQELPQDAPVWVWGFGQAYPLTSGKNQVALSEIYRYEPWEESPDEERWESWKYPRMKVLETKTVLLIG